jgi:hypothetical protein
MGGYVGDWVSFKVRHRPWISSHKYNYSIRVNYLTSF